MPAYAQDTAATAAPTVEQMARERQNPVSGLRSVFLQDVVLPVGQGNANSFSIQPVWPFRLGHKWRLNTYTIIPIQWLPPLYAGGSRSSGLGNVLFNAFLRPQTPSKLPFTWGIGPALQLPTRTTPELGSSALSMGPTGLLYYAGKTVSAGLVAQNLWSLNASGSNRVNFFSSQYIFYYNLPKGWYIESNATITANWLATNPSNVWLVPLGGGPGKTFQLRKGGLFYSAAMQGFYNAARPAGVGSWMAIAQLQIIFSM